MQKCLKTKKYKQLTQFLLPMKPSHGKNTDTIMIILSSCFLIIKNIIIPAVIFGNFAMCNYSELLKRGAYHAPLHLK